MLSVAGGVLDATFEALRSCGRGRDECVVYWTGPVADTDVVDGVVQPDHQAGPTWYEVDSDWITPFFLDLRATRRTVRAQVHTHPGRSVRHSPTDDGFPIAPGIGFTSIVLPFFATGPVELNDAYIAVLDREGNWQELSADEALTWR